MAKLAIWRCLLPQTGSRGPALPDYLLRQRDPKRQSGRAFQLLNYRVCRLAIRTTIPPCWRRLRRYFVPRAAKL